MPAWRAIGTVLIAYVFLCVLLAIFLGELAFRPQRLPARYRDSEKVIAARFGATLQDVSILANGDAVILLHGVGDNREGMFGFAELFLAKGFAVLMPDSRGQGESGGEFPTYGVKESDDVHRWFDWLKTKDHPRCIYGMGESMGAAILLQAVEKETRFCAVVAESSFASFRQIAYIRVGQLIGTGAWLGRVILRPAVELAFLYGRLTRGVNLIDASPEKSVVRSRVPILLVHGLADHNIPAQQSERIRAQNPSVITLWEVEHAGHCGAVNVAHEEFDNRVLGWFTSHDGKQTTRLPQK